MIRSLSDFAGRPVAVTGATGFVGLHLSKRLVELGARVVAITRTVSLSKRLDALGIRCRVAPLDSPEVLAEALVGTDVLFHLAGAVDFDDDWDRFRHTNVNGTHSILSAGRRVGVRRIVHVSSIVAVGASQNPVRLDESALWNLGPLRIPYVTTKREAEVLARSAAEAGQDVVIANPACVLGPEDFSASEFGNLCRRFWQGKVPLHFTGGNNFVDARDVADGLVRVAAFGRTGERYLLGGWNLSYSRFFAELARYGSRPGLRLTLPSGLAPFLAAIGDRFRKKTRRPVLSPAQARLMGWYLYFDFAKARRELGYTVRPISETLADTHTFWSSSQRRAA